MKMANDKLELRILGDCPVRIWGLSSKDRLLRQVRSVVADSPIQASRSVVLLRSDYVYDQRVIRDLVAATDLILEAAGDQPVAAHVDAAHAAAAERLLSGERDAVRGLSMRHVTAESLSGAYIEELLKSEAPLLLPLRAERQAEIERRLFDGSYKGVTDVVTKYVWPMPARWVTRFCAERGIRPNHVTFTGLACVVIATVLFAYGWFALGLVFAWFMTFCDTVDGKLARVTIDASKLGHFLDKIVDIVHPPFWYIAWGIGLSASAVPMPNDDLSYLLAATIGGYIAGRLEEGAFTLFLGGFSMFNWRPFDGRFRLVLARRNPSLIVLTLSLLLGRPDWGLLLVAVWHVLSAAILLARFLQAAYERLTIGPLRPWLQERVAEQPPAPDISRAAHGSRIA